MSKHTITFLPDQKRVEVDEGITLYEAAEKAGLYLNSLCGGVGVCGKCRVQITKGKVQLDKDSIALLSKDEVQKGYVLACQTKVYDDLEVELPPDSRLEQEQILSESHLEKKRAWAETSPLSYSQPDWICQHKRPDDPACLFKPLTCKVYVELPEPTADDNIADTGRLSRELRKKTKSASIEIPYSCLQDLSAKLRANAWKVTATLAVRDSSWRLLQIEQGNRAQNNYGAAIDIGTTTVVVQLVNLSTGEVVGVEGSHNLQARHGEDVLSRIAFACGTGSTATLQQAVLQNINTLMGSISRSKGIDPQDITAVVVAGNTTMCHLLLALPPCAIRKDPYVPTVDLYPQITARELGIDVNLDAVIELLPSVSSYVGGDTVAGVLACGLSDAPETTCLIDVGTNGEIVVGNNQWMLSCSASAGPAFEGGDTKCGMRATRGAIQKVNIEGSTVNYETVAKAKPRGLCGSGLIDLLGELAQNGIIGIDGKLRPSDGGGRIVKVDGELRYIVASPEQTETGEALVITQSDIDNIIRSKAAIFAATKSLVDYAGLTFTDLGKIYIAGGFGSYLDIDKAVRIGLLPDVPRDRIEFIGNSSLLGARMALLSRYAFDKAVHISQNITNIELSHYVHFSEEYIAALYVPHIDKARLFPSIAY